MGLLGEMTVRSDAEDEFTKYPFQAICISEAFLAQTLVSAAMQRYPRQVSPTTDTLHHKTFQVGTACCICNLWHKFSGFTEHGNRAKAIRSLSLKLA